MKLIANLSSLDAQTTQVYGIPSLLLMETAGRQVAEAIAALPDMTPCHPIVVVAGRGNNGGDGFVCARNLYLMGFSHVTVIHVLPNSQMKGDAKLNLDLLKTYPIPTLLATETESALAALAQAEIIVDALFGSALSRPIDSPEKELIKAMNQQREEHGAITVAIDLPSGVNGSNGNVLGTAVQADLTLAITASKPGLHLYPGKAYAGQVEVVNIGIPQTLLEQDSSPLSLLTQEQVASWIPRRNPQGHKYTFGSVLVIAGSRSMPGAAVMTAEAALSTGAGIVTLAAPASVFEQIPLIPEIVRLPLPETLEGSLAPEALTPELLERLQKAQSIIVGPGLGHTPESVAFIKALLQALTGYTGTLLIDADGLNALSSLENERTALLPKHTILTPHLGEFSRLMGIPTPELSTDLVASALNGQTAWGGTLVLKSATTLIAFPNGKLWINATGNAGMATAGSGDVLAGIIASLAAQGASAEQASAAGVFLHGLAGDIAAQDKTQYALRATDITGALPAAFRHLLPEV